MAKESGLKEQLTKIRIFEELKKINEQRLNHAKEREIARDELRSKGKTPSDKEGNLVTFWQSAMRKAEEAIGADVMSYNDWRAAMMSVVTMSYALSKAIHHSIKTEAFFPLRSGLIKLKNVVLDRLTGDPEVDLPVLQHFVQLTDEGKLKIELTRSDNRNEKGVLDELFEKGIVMWLKDLGYLPNREDGKEGTFIDANNVPLNKAKFEQLKNDPDHGLNHFLTEYTDVECSELRPG